MEKQIEQKQDYRVRDAEHYAEVRDAISQKLQTRAFSDSAIANLKGLLEQHSRETIYVKPPTEVFSASCKQEWGEVVLLLCDHYRDLTVRNYRYNQELEPKDVKQGKDELSKVRRQLNGAVTKLKQITRYQEDSRVDLKGLDTIKMGLLTALRAQYASG
jgi:hypothetical protein